MTAKEEFDITAEVEMPEQSNTVVRLHRDSPFPNSVW
jgi:hypothetical protein